MARTRKTSGGRVGAGMAALTFQTTPAETHVHVALTGELDLRGATALDPELARIASEPGPEVVAVDLRELEFMDSSGLRSIMVADASLRQAGRRLILVRGVSGVQRVFAVTRMEERLSFVDDPAEIGGGTAT